MKKTYKNILTIVILIVLLILYFFNSEYIVYNLLDYTKLFYTKLFPVSFIFFIFSSLLIDYKLLEILPINITNIYVFLLSMISGFPSGSKYTKELLNKNIIDYNEAKDLLLFSHFPNPLFVLSSINSVINDKNICIKLLISIILSNFIILLFTKKKKKTIVTNSFPSSFSTSLTKAIISSIKTILLIYGMSIFFYLISIIITKYISFNSYFYILLCGIFDLTNGVFSTSIINNTLVRIIFILLFISFGSISIHMQVKSILNDSILYKSFVKGRIISTIISFIILIILLTI